ncbi:thioesterase family protein [Nocardia panacis]|uniref:Thioesterase family protein n=1 Tax=Nocardia panacis TaxID=2340916 RepID=A0A3A4KD05_9NOCA|nr:thioesterase family protein [Nocardia panacis]RJO78323.1 thioesterase family protein [Nocardia panacis]
MDAFYLPDDSDPNVFHATELTRGPWSPDLQHGGAPSALLGQVIDRYQPRPGYRVGRMTVEMLGPIPIAPLRIETRLVPSRARVGESGRGVEFLEATASSGGEPVLRASAWRLNGTDSELDVPKPTSARTGPEMATPGVDFPSSQPVGFHTGVEFRFVSGGFQRPGPAACWFRLRYPVVAGTEPTPLARALAAADFGNGISSVLPWQQYYFINTDLTVHLTREPVGEWVCLDALTHAEPDGIGLVEGLLSDPQGRLGQSTQTLLIGRR